MLAAGGGLYTSIGHYLPFGMCSRYQVKAPVEITLQIVAITNTYDWDSRPMILLSTHHAFYGQVSQYADGQLLTGEGSGNYELAC